MTAGVSRPEFTKETVLTFGKHKGKTVGLLIHTDLTYLCWLRDQKGAVLFDQATNKTLDKEISNSSYLRTHYKMSTGATSAEERAQAVVKAALDGRPGLGSQVPKPPVVIDRGQAWGSW